MDQVLVINKSTNDRFSYSPLEDLLLNMGFTNYVYNLFYINNTNINIKQVEFYIT